MISYKFVHEKNNAIKLITGNRIWEFIKRDLEEQLGFANSAKSAKKQDESVKPELVAYFQHEISNGNKRTLDLSEYVNEHDTLILQRLPRRITKIIPGASSVTSSVAQIKDEPQRYSIQFLIVK